MIKTDFNVQTNVTINFISFYNNKNDNGTNTILNTIIV